MNYQHCTKFYKIFGAKFFKINFSPLIPVGGSLGLTFVLIGWLDRCLYLCQPKVGWYFLFVYFSFYRIKIWEFNHVLRSSASLFQKVTLNSFSIIEQLHIFTTKMTIQRSILLIFTLDLQLGGTTFLIFHACTWPTSRVYAWKEAFLLSKMLW